MTKACRVSSRTAPSRRRAGQGLVELALVLPLLVMLGATLIDIALVSNAQLTLHRLTSRVANEATQLRDGQYPDEASVRAMINAQLLPPLTAAHLVIDRVAVGTDAGQRRFIDIALHYDMPLHTPGLSFFMTRPSITLSSNDRASYLVTTTLSATPAPPPAVAVTAEGDIQIARNCSARLKVLRKSVRTDASAEVPLKLELADDGTAFDAIFGDNAVNGGEEMTLSGLQTGKRLAIKGKASNGNGSKAYNRTYTSNSKRPFTDNADAAHVVVLRAGDPLPEAPGLGAGNSVSPQLEAFVDPATRTVAIGRKEILVLWEFNDQFGTASTDYQDLVVLVQLYDPATEPRPMTP